VVGFIPPPFPPPLRGRVRRGVNRTAALPVMLILKQVQDDITRFSITIEIPKQVRNDTIYDLRIQL